MAKATSTADAGAGAELTVRVREATRDDMPAVHRMIYVCCTPPDIRREALNVMKSLLPENSMELAAYEGVPDGPTLSVQDLIEDGFESSPPWFFVLIAELEGAGDGGDEEGPLGYALCNRAYSSWSRRALYVEDLYVRPARRRRGVASRLLQRLCQMAISEGVHRIDWHVLEHNAPAQALYARVGAADLRRAEGRAALRLHRDHILRLADDHRYSSV